MCVCFTIYDWHIIWTKYLPFRCCADIVRMLFGCCSYIVWILCRYYPDIIRILT